VSAPPYEGETYAVVTAFVDELVRSDIAGAVVSPGSRSTPVALALARRDDVRLFVHPDERSAAYFALGLAKATGRPAVVLCTSGTAAANYLPAVAEAQTGRVPLVVLTADRPPELRDVAAAQTIDQVRLFAGHAKWSVDLPPPAPLEAVARQARVVADRAVALAAAAPQGPVHVNVPVREPLVPMPQAAPPGTGGAAWQGRGGAGPYARIARPPVQVSPAAARGAAAELAGPRGLVVLGPEAADGPDRQRTRARAAVALAARLGWPVVADVLSAARGLPGVIGRADALVRDPLVADALVPARVLRLGAPPTSKALGQLLERVPEDGLWLVDDGDAFPDPSLRARTVVHADAAAWLAAVAAALPAPGGAGADAWLRRWQLADAAAGEALAACLADEPYGCEGRVMAELGRVLPAGACLFVGNSMPVRDADAFFAARGRGVRVVGSRGASGIDGITSTALGLAAGSGRPCVLAVGDLSFYHDLNGLIAAGRFGVPLTVVVVNNDGGGIFSFLPQARHGEQFERLWGTPLGLDFAHAARLYGASFARPRDWPGFAAAVRSGLRRRALAIVEVRALDRTENVRRHDAAFAAVAGAVRRAWASDGGSGA